MKKKGLRHRVLVHELIRNSFHVDFDIVDPRFLEFVFSEGVSTSLVSIERLRKIISIVGDSLRKEAAKNSLKLSDIGDDLSRTNQILNVRSM